MASLPPKPPTPVPPPKIHLTYPPPPAEFAKVKLGLKKIDSAKLFRASGYTSGEPYFGNKAANRFDDPNKVFGTSYFGFDVETAIAETVLHDLMPIAGHFDVSQSDFENKQIVQLAGSYQLTLANFTDTGLKRVVGDSSLTVVTPYDIPQAWARAVYEHPRGVDGIYYVSKQLNGRRAVVLFDRIASKLGAASYTRLGTLPNLVKIRKTLGVNYAYA